MIQLVSFLKPENWPGLKKLAHSLSTRGNVRGLDWIVLTEKPAPRSWDDRMWQRDFNMINLRLSQVGGLPEVLPTTVPHFRFCFNRLRVFALPPGKYICLDVDLLCMRDATELLTKPSLSAVTGGPSGWNDPGVNTGLLRFNASQELFEWVMDACEAGVHMPIADQDVINRVLIAHPGLLHPLEPQWNTSAARPAPDPIFLHFAGARKPWHPGAPASAWHEYNDES
jgi:hypothetical protein